VPRHDDVRTAAAWWLREERSHVDVVFGGFPCQDISNAGRRAGIGGEQSGLWSEFHGIVRVLRPRWVLLENVAAILGRGAGRVLGDLAEIGYDAEWDCIPAASVGAPHLRDRWFAVAYADEIGRRRRSRVFRSPGWGQPAYGRWSLADTTSSGRDGWVPSPSRLSAASDARDGRQQLGQHWATEPDVGRVAHGVPHRVDRLRGLGNAVVPQVAEHVGRLLVAYDTAVPT
jgi:DNA (cytosine-5)-methyltransferase 1